MENFLYAVGCILLATLFAAMVVGALEIVIQTARDMFNDKDDWNDFD
jgi:hypothetical protein